MGEPIYQEPLHQHDCDECIYLGEWNYHDLWYHPGPHIEILARRSSYGPDYQVYHGPKEPRQVLNIARDRAKEKGLPLPPHAKE